MIISRLFPSNMEFTTCLALAFSIVVFDVFTSHYINPIPSFFSFRTKPHLTEDGKNIEFTLLFSPKNLQFIMDSNYSLVKIPISDFCQNKHCLIPLITGGEQTIKIESPTHTLFSQQFNLHNLSVECTGDNVTSRRCSMKNLCFDKHKFVVKSPYPIDFSQLMMIVGTKIPPDVYAENYLYDKFTTSTEFPKDFVFFNGTSHLIGKEHMMYDSWVIFYDYLVPLYQNISKDETIFALDYIDQFTPFINFVTKKNAYILKETTTCFEEMKIGLKRQQTEKLSVYYYNFEKDSTISLRENVLKEINKNEFHDISQTNKKLFFILRNQTNKILNFPEVKTVFEEFFKDYSIETIYYEETSKIDIIKKVQFADILVGSDHNSLSNVLWMKPSSLVIELSPYKFNCMNWIENAAFAAGVNHIKYVCQNIEETGKIYNKNDPSTFTTQVCWKKNDCKTKFCFETLKSQDLKINITNLKIFLSDSLSK